MANQFIFSDPDVDFVLRDGGPDQDFDGIADEIFPEFGNTILGIDRDSNIESIGESRSIAEFDISSVPTLLNGPITQSTFEVRVSSTQITGLGQGLDDVPANISVYGYDGNGIAEASDFQAGTLLDTLDIPGIAAGDILTFDITEFIDTVIADNASFAGFAVRVDDFGGIAIQEFNEFPQLRIQTDEATNPILLSNPEVDFQVIDGGFSNDFDGVGDSVFNTFNSVILGLPRDTILSEVGEERSIAEFDIRDFTVPDGEEITDARLEIQVSDIQLAGLGQDGSNLPNALSVYGYAGNGIAELSDFNASTLLDTIDSSTVDVGDPLSFDVTSLIRTLVDLGTFAGFAIRTDDVSGISFSESSALGIPRLTIKTAEPTNNGFDITVDTLVDEEDGNISPGDISLREALQTVSSGGSINFAPGLAQADAGFGPGVLGLTLGALVIDKAVTIEGLGADQLTLEQATLETASNDDPNPFARVILVDDGDANNQAEVEISGLTITGGDLLAGDGSGIFNREDLTVRESTITGNGYVFGSSARGSGIFNTGSLRVLNSLISENRGAPSYRLSYGSGLGIFNTGIAEVIDSEISDHSTGGGNGAGILNASSGLLTVRNSTLSNNGFSAGSGGGLANQGSATVINSTIQNNVASSLYYAGEGSGGGISNSGILTITQSTISGNSTFGSRYGGGDGGGINNTGTLTITNSTVSNNSATRDGGGINNAGTADLRNSSIVFNVREGYYDTSPGGGGIFAQGGATTTVSNSIVAQNTDDLFQGNPNGLPLAPDIGGTLEAASGFNLVGDGTGSNVQDGVNGNQVGTGNAPIDPQLGPLQDNGGPTFTHALLANSPAINQGSNALIPDGVTTDQRGEDRVVGGTVDIGAYESDVINGGTTPTVDNPIADQLIAAYRPYIFEIPDTTFSDADGDMLTLDATLGDGQPLPDWLSFDADTDTLRGLPLGDDLGGVVITITATDDDNNSVSDTFDLKVDIPIVTSTVINGNNGNNILHGTGTNDLIQGFGGTDRLWGQNGNDKLLGGEGQDTMGGGAGDDFLSGDTGNDKVFGGSGDDVMLGGEGSDRLFGNSGNDTLAGDEGNDVLNGGNDDDILLGGSGQNQLRGGQGSDGFVVEQLPGFSTVKDFNDGEDTLILRAGLTFSDITITPINNSKTEISVGTDVALVLNGVNANAIDASDFTIF